MIRDAIYAYAYTTRNGLKLERRPGSISNSLFDSTSLTAIDKGYRYFKKILQLV